MPERMVAGYWMHETSGVLRPVVERYLAGAELEPDELALMRLYLRQWIAGDFAGPKVAALRRYVDQIGSTGALRLWLEQALDAGIDPL